MTDFHTLGQSQGNPLERASNEIGMGKNGKNGDLGNDRR